MQQFKAFKADKLKDQAFYDLFERECHVCRVTVSVIERLHESGRKEKVLAELGISEKALQDLEDADYCDPALVIRLCEYLGIAPPVSCPRR